MKALVPHMRGTIFRADIDFAASIIEVPHTFSLNAFVIWPKLFYHSGMKSHRRLYGIIFLAWLLSGCSTSGSKPKDGFTADKIAKELKQEQSLSSDRKQLEALRSQIPEETRIKNDEEAQWLEWMGKTEKKPTDIRNRYYETVRKQRERHRGKVQKIREEFSKKERVDRELFVKQSKESRDKFVKRKSKSSDAQKSFFAEEESKRKAFFSEQQDRRRSFESELNMQSQDFEAKMREQQKAFSERIREYTDRYNRAQKESKSNTKPAGAPASPSEFQEMDAVPATPLAPPEDE